MPRDRYSAEGPGRPSWSGSDRTLGVLAGCQKEDAERGEPGRGDAERGEVERHVRVRAVEDRARKPRSRRSAQAVADADQAEDRSVVPWSGDAAQEDGHDGRAGAERR